MNALALPLLAIVPHSPAVHEQADQVERNFYYDEEGKHVFTQLIFRDFIGGGYKCYDFRVLKECRTNPRGRIVLHDGEFLRVIHSKSIYETWTQYDPELYERSRWPKDQRRGLR